MPQCPTFRRDLRGLALLLCYFSIAPSLVLTLQFEFSLSWRNIDYLLTRNYVRVVIYRVENTTQRNGATCFPSETSRLAIFLHSKIPLILHRHRTTRYIIKLSYATHPNILCQILETSCAQVGATAFEDW